MLQMYSLVQHLEVMHMVHHDCRSSGTPTLATLMQWQMLLPMGPIVCFYSYAAAVPFPDHLWYYVHKQSQAGIDAKPCSAATLSQIPSSCCMQQHCTKAATHQVDGAAKQKKPVLYFAGQ